MHKHVKRNEGTYQLSIFWNCKRVEMHSVSSNTKLFDRQLKVVAYGVLIHRAYPQVG